MSLPVMSQQKPAATENDAKVIFVQDFEPSSSGLSAEDAWQEWQTTPVDTIRELYYYNRIATGTVSNANIYDGTDDWNIAFVRTDSTTEGYEPGSGIILKNGVVVTNNKNDKANDIYNEEVYGIKADGDNIERAQAFEKYGEDGGDYYFSYTSGNADGADGYSSGVVPNYRRDLFVRGLPIEDNSSYRLTFYIKATKLGSTKPTFYADVMRGYYNSEKPFSLDLTNGAATFEYKKEKFTGDWEKVTFMTYYQNDSIADGYVYAKGYYWYNDWNYTYNGKGYTCIKQPDKFFVRLSFASDSTAFELDNLSLTKSWIGGVEHTGNMIRVDFGYETNLLELAAAAEAETNIAAVELPGQYFEVSGYVKGRGWYPIAIESAEYHDDGYMYMWSKDVDAGGGRLVPNPFTSYDTVLVSFINPVDNEKICLKYDGSTYPCALDKEWVDAGKTVKNFTNEPSKLNPNITVNQFGKKVYSMKQLPPVIQSLPFEKGSFGLEAFNQITIGMSRVIEYEANATEQSELGFLRVTKAGVKEIWTVSESTDSTATFVRSASDINKNGALVGDYKFEFMNLKGVGTDYAKTQTIEYGFGHFNHNPSIEVVYATDFKESSVATQSVPTGAVIWNGKDAFTIGDGSAMGTKSRLFWTNPASGFTSGFYISGRAEGSADGHMVYGVDANDPITLKAGVTYSITFSAAYWDNACETNLYIYPNTFAADKLSEIKSLSTENKTLIATFTPSVKAPYNTIQKYDPPYGSWPNGTETFSFQFTVPANGNYLLEWEVMKNSTNGLLLSDFTIATVGDLSFPYVTKLNASVAKAQDKVDNLDEMYYGTQYDALAAVAQEYFYENWESTKPSDYDAATAVVDNELKLMQLRIDTVDLYYTTENKAYDKIAEFDGNTEGYTELEAFVALDDMVYENEDLDITELTNSEITAKIKAYEDAIKALDDRIALMTKFNDKLAEVKKLIEAEDAHQEYDEYAVMVRAYNTADAYDQITPTDAEYTEAYNALCEGENTYVFKVDGVVAMTKQAKELYALADSLGYKFDENIKAAVASLSTKNEALEELLREAAILQIYKIYAANDEDKMKDMEGFNVSALAPNYFMYTIADPETDMRKNSSGKWVYKSSPNSTAIPNWTITFAGSYGSSGSSYPGKEAMDWETNAHIFIAGNHFENNTTGTASITVNGLPLAYYRVGIEMGQNNLSNSKFNFVTDSTSIEVKGSKKTSVTVFSADSIWVTKASPLTATYTITGASGSGHVDVNGLVLELMNPDTKVNYADLVTAQEAKVADLLTFVDAPAAEAGVQYFNLGGAPIAAPKAGDIVIKRTVLSNGNAIVEKILVK